MAQTSEARCSQRNSGRRWVKRAPNTTHRMNRSAVPLPMMRARQKRSSDWATPREAAPSFLILESRSRDGKKTHWIPMLHTNGQHVQIVGTPSRDDPRSLPIWSCSVWGLPCPPHYCGSGALLPHLFTLTWRPLESRFQAVCFLWHFPSSELEPTLPDVIRHTALRSSDFPPPLLDEARATVRSSCQHFIICDGLQPTEVQVAGQTMHNSPGDSRHGLSGGWARGLSRNR